MVACQRAILSIWANCCSRHEKLRVIISKSPDKQFLMIAYNSYQKFGILAGYFFSSGLQ